MRKYFLFISLVLGCLQLCAQQFLNYLPIDSARRVIANAKTLEDKFYGYYGADRFYMNAGFFDSSEFAQKEMYTIAKNLNRDSLLCDVYAVMSNRYLLKQDFNYALMYALKAFEYAKDPLRRNRVNINIGGVYAWSNNYETALEYLRRRDALGDFPTFRLFFHLYYGMSYNGLNKPDSALVYLQKADEYYKIRPDVNGYSQALGEVAKAYDLKGDNELATVYYKRALQLSTEKGVQTFALIVGNKYAYYLLKQGKYAEAGNIARDNIRPATTAGNFTATAAAAEILQRVYNRNDNNDSAYQYALMQIAYKDSASNQKRVTEFQNLTFSQRLKDIDEASKSKHEEEERKQNIQYVLIALGIIVLITLYLSLSRSFITNTKLIKFFGVIALLIVFEFLNLLLHPFLEKVTNHSPVLMLLALVCIAALLVPLHHKLEKWATTTLVEKNKKIRLATAKKTIEELEKANPPGSGTIKTGNDNT